MFHRMVTLTLLLQVLPAVLPAAGVLATGTPAAGTAAAEIPVVGRVFGPNGEPLPKAENRPAYDWQADLGRPRWNVSSLPPRPG